MKDIDEIVGLASEPQKDTSEEELLSLAKPQQEDIAKETTLKDRLAARANAAYLGALDFAGGLANTVYKGGEGLYNLLGAPHAAEALKAQSEGVKQHYKNIEGKNKANLQRGIGGLGASRLAGNVAALAPLPLKGFTAAAKIPNMAKRLASYSGLGASQGAAIGGLQLDPNSEQPVNVSGAIQGAVGGGLLGMPIGGASRWVQRTKALQKLKDKTFGADVLSRDTKTKRMISDLWDAIPLLGGRIQRERQRQGFPNAINKFIKSLSKEVGKEKNFKDTTPHLERIFKKAVGRLKDKEEQLWGNLKNNVDKSETIVPMMDTAKKSAKEFLDEFGDLGLGETKKFIQNVIKKPVKSFNDLKQLRTDIRHQKTKLYTQLERGKISYPVYDKMKSVYSDLTEALEDTATRKGGTFYDDFIRANEYTKQLHNLLEEGGSSMKDAIADNARSFNFISKLITEKNPTQVKRMLKPFSKEDLSGIRASILKKHLDESVNETGNFNVSKFLEKTSSEKNTDIIFGDTYKALKGLNQLLGSNLSSYEAGIGLRLATGSIVGTSLGGSAVAGSMAGSIPGALAAVGGALVGSRVLTGLVGKSPLKTSLIQLGKLKSLDSDVAKVLIKRTNNLLKKAGYVLVSNVLDKEEK